MAKKKKEETPVLPIDPDSLPENGCKELFINGKHIIAHKEHGEIIYYELTPLGFTKWRLFSGR